MRQTSRLVPSPQDYHRYDQQGEHHHHLQHQLSPLQRYSAAVKTDLRVEERLMSAPLLQRHRHRYDRLDRRHHRVRHDESRLLGSHPDRLSRRPDFRAFQERSIKPSMRFGDNMLSVVFQDELAALPPKFVPLILTGGQILTWVEARHAMANGENFLRVTWSA